MTWLLIAIVVGLYFVYVALQQNFTTSMETFMLSLNGRFEGLGEAIRRLSKEDEEDESDETKLQERIQKQVYQTPPRYLVHDEYAVAEMHRKYDRSDVRGRIRFLT